MEKQNLPRMSLEEISKEINISRTTLYKVINNKGKVKESTRKFVEDALKKYNYVPNLNGRNLAKNKRYRIAYIGMEHLSASYFFESTKKGLDEAVQKYIDDGLDLVITNSIYEKPEEQIKNIDAMLAEGIRSFIIAVSDAKVIDAKIKQLVEMGCKVIYHSRWANEKLIYIGADYYNSGVTAAEMMSKILPMGGRVQVITNSTIKDDVYARNRCQGFLDKIKEYKNIEIVSVKENINTEEDACKYTNEILDDENLAGIFDVTYKTETVAKTLVERGMGNKIKLIGFDLYKEVIPYVKSSVIDAIIGQDLKGQAYLAAELLFKNMCYNKPFKKENYYSKVDILIGSNAEDYMC